MYEYLIVDKISFRNGAHIFLNKHPLEDMAKAGWLLTKETDDQLVFTKQKTRIVYESFDPVDKPRQDND